MPQSDKHQIFSFPLPEWWELVAKASALSSEEPRHAALLLRDFFEERFAHDPRAEDKWDRFYAALSYLNDNINSFDYGRAAVAGEKEYIASRNVWIALFRYFSHATPEMLSSQPPTSMIRDMIAEHENDAK